MNDETAFFSNLPDDVVLSIFFKLNDEDEPRSWSRLACVCTKFSSLVRTVCWKIRCLETIPTVVADLISGDVAGEPPGGGWSSLHRLAVVCPGLLRSGVLLRSSDLGLDRELGENFAVSDPIGALDRPRPVDSGAGGSGSGCSWSLFDDLYLDTVYDNREDEDEIEIGDSGVKMDLDLQVARSGIVGAGVNFSGTIRALDQPRSSHSGEVEIEIDDTDAKNDLDLDLERELGAKENFSRSDPIGTIRAPNRPRSSHDLDHDHESTNLAIGVSGPSREQEKKLQTSRFRSDAKTDLDLDLQICKRSKIKHDHDLEICRSTSSHLATGARGLSREQGLKLLASRFRSDGLYVSEYRGCVHVEEKRSYMVFRGIFKNFKRTRVWRTINDGNRTRVGVDCAFCECKQTWDLHSAFCLRRGFGFHDDGEPVVRAYVCENGHVAGAWTESELYA